MTIDVRVCIAHGMKPDQVQKVTSAEDDVERAVYLYTLP